MKFICALTLSIMLGCSSSNQELACRQVDSQPSAVPKLPISNADVAWDGTDLGIMPKVTRQGVLDVLASPDCSAPFLVDALLDPNRYVVAHVLLTDLSNEPWGGDGGAWNGLHVQLYADGRTTFEGNDRQQLHTIWLHQLTSGSLTTACRRRRAGWEVLGRRVGRSPAAPDAER